MRTATLLMVFASAFALAPDFVTAAEEEDHSAHHPPPAAAAEKAPAGEHDHGNSAVDPLQQGMQRIEDLMHQIRNTDDIDQKRTLLAEHLQAMRDQMQLVRAADRPAKTAVRATDKKEGSMGGMMKGGGMMEKHKKVEQRLDMLERLLQQSLEREAVEEALDTPR
jgi:hypothetical protein